MCAMCSRVIPLVCAAVTNGCIIKYWKKFRIPKLPRFTGKFENVWQLILQNQNFLKYLIK